MEEKAGGMSRGCLVGIIVASSLLLLLIVSLVTCWYYKEDLAKWGTAYTISGLKAEAARHPEIVDTTRFNALIDRFVERFKTEPLDPSRWQIFMTTTSSLSGWVSDKMLDTAEIIQISDAIVAYYPDLDSLRPIRMEEPVSMPVDTTFPPVPADSE
ncbi:MAG: hypothetical protein HY851_11520 [candidate division Zixibacteria bacterium]|nr:hypothetical protein [candidate division Zixibacteria bacterium]